MTRRAWTYIWAVLGGAILLALLAALTSPVDARSWLPFAGLTVLACMAQLYEAEAPGRQSYYPHVVFFFAGVLLLPPPLFVLLVTIPHVVEWGKERLMRGPHLQSWYIQPFNIAAHVVAGLAAYWVYRGAGVDPVSSYTMRSVLGATIAAAAYVLINHVLVGWALVLARGITWKESGVMAADSLMPDAVLSLLGYVVAVVVGLSPWLALPALAPLALVHRVFLLFRLKRDDFTDAMTGLWNSRHFNSILNSEVERARRFNRDLSLTVIELDTGKELSGRYGQVALDTVVAGMGQILRVGTRQYDVCARLNETEFAVLLPETNPFEALIVARRLRTGAAEARFQVETSQEPIGVAVSMGIASFPGDGVDSAQLIESAARAAQYAAGRGKNHIICAPDVPRVEEQREGGLELKGEFFAPSSAKAAGFANPALRNPHSN